MVYKIQGHFDKYSDKAYENKLNKLSNNFVFIIIQDMLYCALKDFNFSTKAEEELKKIFPVKDFIITIITKKNLNNQSEIMQSWITERYVELETQQYEFENQESLRQGWIMIDNIEKDLIQLIEKKKGGNV